MQANFQFLVVLLLGLLSLSSCDTGQKLDNIPPETSIFLDEIKLEGENRLASVIRLYWLGEDVDGYVTGYEISLDNQNWKFTTRTDSTFNFEIPSGQDSTDVTFYVRAIDNEDARDPEPDFLSIPLINTPPVAVFDTVNTLPDTFFTVGALSLIIDDFDGSETVDSVFIKANEGDWFYVDPNTTIASLLPQNPTSATEQSASVYENLEAPGSELMNGLKLGSDNVFYVRAVDIAGSESKIDTSNTIFIKEQTGDLLVLDDYNTITPDSTYLQVLNKVYPSFDRVEIRTNVPALWNPTFRIWIDLYDKIFWYGDGQFADGTESLMVELAGNEIINYLNDGGKLILSTSFGGQFNSRANLLLSPLFEFTPMDSLANNLGQARLPINNTLDPRGEFDTDFSPLVSGSFGTGLDPYYPKDTSNTIFLANLTGAGRPWNGPQDMIGRTIFTNGETNLVFSSIELHNLRGDKAALEAFFDQILNGYFDW
ncbi:MAG: hypothetical protein AAFY71_03085 [Bacteroidota bacterium]